MDARTATLAADGRNLEATRQLARRAPDQAVREAARQFEAVFMNMLLKSMRESLPKEDPLNGASGRMYTDMLDQQLSTTLAGSGKGLGLADMLVKQLGGAATPPAQRRAALEKVNDATRAAQTPENASAATPEGPAAFVRSMRGHAAEVEREFGIPAHFSLGQAALESGWGRREIRAADGTPSHNLFGIKAGANWNGPTVDVTTTEYANGAPQKVVQRFRAYASYSDAFRDYAKLVTTSPRYGDAVRAAGDASAYARALKVGGYATDPAYADKLSQVINRTLSLTQRVA